MDVLGPDIFRRVADALLQCLRREFDLFRVGGFRCQYETLIVLARELGVDRQQHFLVIRPPAGKPDGELHALR